MAQIESEIIIEKAKKAALDIAGNSGVQRVILFGSRARGEAGPFSDIDLCVVMEHDLASLTLDFEDRLISTHETIEEIGVLLGQKYMTGKGLGEIDILVIGELDLEDPDNDLRLCSSSLLRNIDRDGIILAPEEQIF